MELNYLKSRFRDIWFLQVSRIFSVGLFLVASVLVFLGIKDRSVKYLLMSIRYCYYGPSQKLLYKKFRSFDYTKLLSSPASRKDAVGRAIILSAPYTDESGVFQKGVMLLTFSHTFSYFLRHEKWSTLNKYFAFVLEPSWAGYADPDILAFCQNAGHCVIQASEIKDRILINTMFPEVPCVDTGASNWIDDQFFAGSDVNSGKKKEYDAIYVANLNPIKRVFRAIDAVKEAKKKNKNIKVVVVCAGWGSGNIDALRKHISHRGVDENLILLEGMSQDRLIELVLRSKCSFLLSFKEGSNRVLFESMFLNVPVVCVSENIGVNKSYINAETGLLIPDSLVHNAMCFMSENYARFSPREWALKNISPEKTTKDLSGVLRARYRFEVNYRLSVKVNSPEVRYRRIDLSEFDFLEMLLDAKNEAEFADCCRLIYKKMELNGVGSQIDREDDE